MRNSALFHAVSGEGQRIIVEDAVTLEMWGWPWGEAAHGQGGLGIVEP